MTGGDAPPSKVGRVLRRYDLDGVGDELEHRWTRREDRWSLRDLADWLNRRVLEAAMSEAGLQPVDGEVENSYRVLTEDAVSEADRIQLRRALERDGVDVDALVGDFVTYQAVRSYLQDVRGASYDESGGPSTASVRERLERLVGRTTRVTEENLERLRESGAIGLGEFRLLTEVQVYCEGCDSQYAVGDLLDRGRCDCQPERD